jgi:hypothetical protein
MEALDFETESLSKVASTRLERISAQLAQFAGRFQRPGSDVSMRI